MNGEARTLRCWRSFRALAIAASFAVTVSLLAGCHGGTVTNKITQGRTPRADAAEEKDQPSIGSPWFALPGGIRFETAVLLRGDFVKVPLTAVAAVDAGGHLTFVGVNEMGFRLVEASFSQGDRPRVRLHPLLARAPGLSSRLPLALERIFLDWPKTSATDSDSRGYPVATDVLDGIRFSWQENPTRLTGKAGRDERGEWSVSLRYAPEAAPQAPPVEMIYRGDGLVIVFKLKDITGDE